MNANEEKEKKAKLRNFTFVKSADDRLEKISNDSGRTMTMVLEDYLLGRRQFSPEIEQFLTEEQQRTGLSRDQIIETAVDAYRKSKGVSGLIKRAIEAGDNPVVSSGKDIDLKSISEAAHHTAHPRHRSKRK